MQMQSVATVSEIVHAVNGITFGKHLVALYGRETIYNQFHRLEISPHPYALELGIAVLINPCTLAVIHRLDEFSELRPAFERRHPQHIYSLPERDIAGCHIIDECAQEPFVGRAVIVEVVRLVCISCLYFIQFRQQISINERKALEQVNVMMPMPYPSIACMVCPYDGDEVLQQCRNRCHRPLFGIRILHREKSPATQRSSRKLNQARGDRKRPHFRY